MKNKIFISTDTIKMAKNHVNFTRVSKESGKNRQRMCSEAEEMISNAICWCFVSLCLCSIRNKVYSA